MLGLALRLYRLPTVPLGGHGDVAWNGIEALDWLHGAKWPFYIYHIYAPEPVIIYLTGLSILVFGPTFFAARLVTALASALVMPVGFAAARWLGGEEKSLPSITQGEKPLASTDIRTAWIFALGYAVSFYPILLSKTGQRAQVFPLLVAALIALFAYAWRSGKWWAFAASALVMAVANYTYIPARLMPVLILVWVGYELIRRRTGGAVREAPLPRTQLLQIAAMFALSALLVAPQIALYLRTPEAFFARSSQSAGQLIFQTGLAGADLWLALGRKLLGEFAIFLLPWRGAYSEMSRPLLELPLGLAASGAMIAALWRRRDRALWWPLLGVPVMFATDVVSGTQPEPHGLRMIGVLPLAFLLAARGLALAWGWAEARFPSVGTRHALPLRIVLVFIIVLPGLAGLWQYHFRHIPALMGDLDTTNRLEAADVYIAQLALEHADDGRPILISLDDFTRPNITYLLSQRYPVRRSAVLADGSLDLPDLQRGMLVVIPLDEDRPRHDGLVPENNGRGWVMLTGTEMRLLPPLRLENGFRGVRIDTQGNWIGAHVAHIYEAYLPADSQFEMDIQPVGANLSGEIELAGYSAASQTLTPGEPLWLTLYWRTLAGASEDYETFVQVIDAQGQAVAKLHRWTFDGEYRTTLWQSDELTPMYLRLDIPEDVPPGPYTVIAGLYRVLKNEPLPVIDAAGNAAAPHATISGFKVALPAAEVTQPAPAETIRFGGTIDLAGVNVEPQEDALVLRFDWRAVERPSGDHTLFVHVINEAGEIVAQADTRPRGGTYPTFIWDPGEVVTDEIRLTLPPGLQEGIYRIYIGWYTLPSGERLAALLDGETVPDNRVLLAEFRR